MKKVSDFMNKNVIYFNPEDSIFEVAKVFSKNNISGAPVVENKKVIDVISESDIVKFMSMKFGKKPSAYPSTTFMLLEFMKNQAESRRELNRISKTQIRDVMSKDVVYVSSDMSLFDAACLMEKKDINRLPVIDDGKLVGILARADLIKALIE